MKRVGVLLTSEPGGGAHQYTQTILDAVLALPRDEYSIVAAYSKRLWESKLGAGIDRVELDDSLWNRGLHRGWHLSRLPISAWRRSAAHLDTNIRALIGEHCDLWVCPNHDSYSFRAPVPTLGTVHDLMHRYEPSFPEVSADGEFALREFHFGETCRWAKGVLVDSSLGKRQLIESYGIEDERVFVLPFIAPRYIFEYTDAADAGFESRYSLPRKFFFYPAQFYLHKNHRALVEAMALMREQHPDVCLVLVGSQERNGFADVMSLVKEKGLERHVLFVGYVPDADMPGFFKRARALVMPSFFGPTNIPPLEAFALGCPVATSRIYGIPNQLGNAALLFNPRSLEEIRDCLVRLWTDDALCADLRERGREHSRNWGQAQFAARFRDIVAQLA